MYEGSAAPGANGEQPPATPPVNYTKEQLDEAKNSAAAAARRDAEAKLKETNERLAALEAEKKEREEAELSEVEKLKKLNEESTGKLSEYETKLKAYEEAEEKRKAELLEKVEKEMEGLTDEQKATVNKMPLDGKLDLIDQLKNIKAGPGNWAKAAHGPGAITAEDVNEIRLKYGANSNEFREAYKKYKSL
jgi:catalase